MGDCENGDGKERGEGEWKDYWASIPVGPFKGGHFLSVYFFSYDHVCNLLTLS